MCSDVQNAKSAVNRFSVGMHEEGDNDDYANLATVEHPTRPHPRLEITYTTVPPVVWGGDTHHVQMAKAILGL